MRRVAFVLAALAVVACHTPAPWPVERELARTPKDQALVVFFTDFQCPFCRRTHLALHRALASRPGRSP